MTTEPHHRKSTSVTFSVPSDRSTQQQTYSSTESDYDYEPTISTITPTALTMVKTIRNVKTFKRSWDSDKALRSTQKGPFGKYQLRAYLFVALGYGIIAAWLTEMPTFALLLPTYLDCTPRNLILNQSAIGLNGTTLKISSENIGIPGQTRVVQNYNNQYGRSAITDLEIFCDKARLKRPYISYIVGLILGGLIFGYMADHSGRKMILLGSMWTACSLSLFQLLSEDYISYVFFACFLGLAIGAVHVITIPYVMEMFPIESRAIYGLSLLGIVFLLDLVIPWLALLIKNWKILQGVISIPLIITAALYWFTEESMFWHTTQKDYFTAVLSLTKIARFNGVTFNNIFREAYDFLNGKHSKGIQCDFQPLLRLEDVKGLTSKYPDFDMVDLQTTTTKKNSLTQRISQVITGHHYNPTLSTFYPTDYLHSYILTMYLFIMCGLWLVSSLTEYSLDIPHLTQYLTDDFYFNYFYTHLIQILSFVVAFPLVHFWGRRWPTFCFFLIAEVCLLGSVAVKLDDSQIRLAMLIVYFTGKFATRAAFIVIIIYTCEIFPTGLRCTTFGICYTFRLIGIALASPNVGEVNGWMPRLIYGILSLIIGSMALLLPETKKFPLPRTMIQIEAIPTSISQHFRRQRPAVTKKNVRSDSTHPEGGIAGSDAVSVVSGVRSTRPYDNQSTLHSVYELREFGQDDTIHSMSNRNSSRSRDPRSSSLFPPNNGISNEGNRPQQRILEDVEYGEDVDDDRVRLSSQPHLTEPKRKKSTVPRHPIKHSDNDVMILPTRGRKQSFSDEPTQLEMTAQIQRGDVTEDRNGGLLIANNRTRENNQEENLSQSPRLRRTMSQDENYFSEHC